MKILNADKLKHDILDKKLNLEFTEEILNLVEKDTIEITNPKVEKILSNYLKPIVEN